MREARPYIISNRFWTGGPVVRSPSSNVTSSFGSTPVDSFYSVMNSNYYFLYILHDTYPPTLSLFDRATVPTYRPYKSINYYILLFYSYATVSWGGLCVYTWEHTQVVEYNGHERWLRLVKLCSRVPLPISTTVESIQSESPIQQPFFPPPADKVLSCGFQQTPSPGRLRFLPTSSTSPYTPDTLAGPSINLFNLLHRCTPADTLAGPSAGYFYFKVLAEEYGEGNTTRNHGEPIGRPSSWLQGERKELSGLGVCSDGPRSSWEVQRRNSVCG